jgi:hypothetical protein
MLADGVWRKENEKRRHGFLGQSTKKLGAGKMETDSRYGSGEGGKTRRIRPSPPSLTLDVD